MKRQMTMRCVPVVYDHVRHQSGLKLEKEAGLVRLVYLAIECPHGEVWTEPIHCREKSRELRRARNMVQEAGCP